jgi:hypothetical protein
MRRTLHFALLLGPIICPFVCTIISGAHQASAATAPKDRRYASARHGISVEAPTGWTLSTHTGFPSILVLLVHPDASRISIAVSDSAEKTPRDLAETNRKGLETQGLKIIGVRAGARGGIEVEAQSAPRAESLVQLYLLRAPAAPGPRQAIVITMVTPTASLVVHRAAFDYVVGKLGLNPLPDAPDRSPTTEQRPADAGVKSSSAAERAAEEPRR